MNKVELAIGHLGGGDIYKVACAVLLAVLMEEFGPDVTDVDVEKCILELQGLKRDLRD